MSASQNSILTVGSLAFDSIESPAGKAEKILGGSVNYFSIAASFSVPISVVGVVGQDFPKDHLQALSKRGINVDGVQIVAGKTFHWAGSYDTNLSEAKTLSTQLNVFEHFNPELSKTQSESRYLFLANIDPVLQQRVLAQMKKTDLVACDSMNFWIAGKADEVKQTLKSVDIISINEGEAYLLTGTRNLALAAKKIREMGPTAVVLKRGEYGAALFTDSGTFLAPAYLTDTVKDPTGAGDSFAGALMGSLARAGVTRDLRTKDPQAWDHALRKGVLAGCVMASFTVEDFGFQRLMSLTQEELLNRNQRLLEMIRP